MELDWIEDFLVLAESGIFSKAALRRNVTQSAFTRRIRKLEYAMGAVLFDRSTHPVVLTPAGEEFRPVAAEVLRSLSGARARLRSLAGSEEMVAVASLQALAAGFLPGFLGDIYRDRPPPAIKVMAEDFAGCVEALLTGTADILLSYAHPSIVTAELDGRFLSCPVGEDVLVAVTAPDAAGSPRHALGDARIPYLRYSAESFLGKVTARIVEGSDLRDRLVPAYQNSMADGLRAAARAGLGVAWLPLRSAAEDLARGSLLRISAPGQEEPIAITMFREAAPKSRPVERLWAEFARRADPVGPPA